MPKNFFTKKIICENCLKKFRYIQDRKIPKYICLTYSKYGINNKYECDRNAIEESFLLDMIERYCWVNKIEYEPSVGFIQDLIRVIYVSEEGDIRIEYKNGDSSIISDNLVKI